MDSNIFLKINPCLLTGEVEVEKQERKIKKYILVPALPFILK
jgi:hypothetical protein